jgi:hypothetical protein
MFVANLLKGFHHSHEVLSGSLEPTFLGRVDGLEQGRAAEAQYFSLAH